jgi:hypothetical protein
MKKAWIAVVAVALMALPATAAAKHHSGEFKNAAKYCKSLRVQMGVDQFKATYKNKGKCVKQRVRELRTARRAALASCKQEVSTRAALRQCVRSKVETETGDDDQAVVNAAKQCATERQPDPAAFDAKYGTNENHRNAFGKCVSQHAAETGDNNGANEGEGPQPQS